MSQPLKAYWALLRGTSRGLSARFGVELRYSDVAVRALASMTAAQFAVLIKLLVDKGVITDADLQAAIAEAAGVQWDPEPVDPTPLPAEPPPDPVPDPPPQA